MSTARALAPAPPRRVHPFSPFLPSRSAHAACIEVALVAGVAHRRGQDAASAHVARKGLCLRRRRADPKAEWVPAAARLAGHRLTALRTALALRVALGFYSSGRTLPARFMRLPRSLGERLVQPATVRAAALDPATCPARPRLSTRTPLFCRPGQTRAPRPLALIAASALASSLARRAGGRLT